MRRPGLPDWIGLLALVVLWGSAFALTELALAGFTPLQIVVVRAWIGAGALLLILAARGARLSSGPRAWLYILSMSVLGNVLPFYLISWGQQVVSSGLAGIFMAFMPLTVLVLAHLLVPGERMTVLKVAGLVLGLAGIVLLTGPDVLRELAGEGSTLLAQLAVLGGAVCYGLNLIVARLSPPMDAMVLAAWVLLGAAGLATLAWGLGGAPFPRRPGVVPLGALAALGLLSTGLATVVYFAVVRRAGPTFLSLINYLIPVYAVLAGTLALGEELAPRSLAALAVILAGVVLSQRRSGTP